MTATCSYLVPVPGNQLPGTVFFKTTPDFWYLVQVRSLVFVDDRFHDYRYAPEPGARYGSVPGTGANIKMTNICFSLPVPGKSQPSTGTRYVGAKSGSGA